MNSRNHITVGMRLVFLAVCLAAPLPAPAMEESPPCETAGTSCPLTGPGWALYADSNPEAPDFWWTASVDVREISVCDHGIQFLLPVVQDGRPREAALVFPRPSRRMLAERLHLGTDSAKLEEELAHFSWRYASLQEGLQRISRGAVLAGSCVAFTAGSEPTLTPNTRLALSWNGEELELRGYLDVYFRRDPPVIVAADVERGGGVAAGVSLAASGDPGGGSALRVAPNPGGRGDYRISYTVPVRGPVALRVYDVAGRRVATLAEGVREAGSGRLRWNGRTLQGHVVGRGVYFLRLTTPGGSRTTKLVHLGG